MLAIVITAALAATAPKGVDHPAPPQATQTAMDKAGVEAAEKWASLLDAQRWQESWKASGSMFRSQVPEARWISTIEPLRLQMGSVSSRALKGVTSASTLPGAPNGNYKIIQFETNFANKQDAVETVVLAEEGGNWKVSGYFIR